mgnify:CR=1 FL=1
MLLKKPGHDPVVHSIESLQILFECLRDGYSSVCKNNQFAKLYLEDARMLFREYFTGYPENKWDGFMAERMKVMDCIKWNQIVMLRKIHRKDIFTLLPFIIDDLKRFQAVREEQQHTA